MSTADLSDHPDDCQCGACLHVLSIAMLEARYAGHSFEARSSSHDQETMKRLDTQLRIMEALFSAPRGPRRVTNK